MTKFLLCVFAVGVAFSFANANESKQERKPNSEFTKEYQALLNQERIRMADKEREWAEHQEYLKLIDKGGR